MDDRFNGDGLVCSAHYAETMEEAVLPYLKQRETQISVHGVGGKSIYCVRYDADAPRGTVLLVHGFTENACKFSELIYSLLQNGYSAVAYDHRGHGRSWRDDAVRADTSLTHVSDFNEYVKDMDAVYTQVVASMPKPFAVFSHSMGGAVTGLFLERRPQAFSRAVFCAPMIAPNTSGLPKPVVTCMCRFFKLLGKEKERIFASKPYSGPERFETSCATGRERFDWYDKVKAAHKEFWNNGPTYGWLLNSVKVTRELLKKGEPERISCPVLLFTAENDGSVMPAEQETFISRITKGKHVFVQGARHEIYRSNDEVLFPWWHSILSFLQE